MVLKTAVLYLLIVLTSLPASADELDLNPWYQLHLLVQQQQREDARTGLIFRHTCNP